MREIATLDRVRRAQEALRAAKVEHPSADAIIKHIGGGSKGTVLGHMRTLAEEAARAAPDGEIPLELLRSSADRMVRQLWESACAMASKAHETKMEAMLSSQAARYAELQAAALVEEDLRTQLAESKARIEELEKQGYAEQQLETILMALRADRGPVHPPIVQLLRLLDARQPRTREDLFKLMVEAGHSRKQAGTALSEARKRGFANEQDGGALITEAGTDRLRYGRRRAKQT